MATNNVDPHKMGSLLQNTFQLHSKLNKSLPGSTHKSILPSHTHTNYDTSYQHSQKSQHQYLLSSEETKPIGLGLDTTLDSAHFPHSQGHIRGQSNGIETDLSASSSIPSSPIKSSFSSPQLPQLPSASIFGSTQEQENQNQSLSQGKDQFRSSLSSSDKSGQNLPISTMTLPLPTMAKGDNSTPYTRHYTRSLSAGGIYQQQQQSYQSPPSHIRRNKTSLSTLASIDHNGKFVHPHFSSFNNIDPKDDTSTISLNIRFVSKGLWVRVDIPRNSSVQVARDLVLEKCQLTMIPPSAPPSVADTIGDDDSASIVTSKHIDDNAHHGPGRDPTREIEEANITESSSVDNITTGQSNRKPTGRSRSKSINKTSDNSSIKDEKDVRHSNSSLSEIDIQQKTADLLVTRLDMLHNSLNGLGVAPSKTNYVKAITDQSQSFQPHNSTKTQFKRLWSNSSIHSEDHHGTSPPDRVARDNSTSTGRSGWGWKDRNSGNSSKNTEREINELPDFLTNCQKYGCNHQSDVSSKDCEAWKSSFGLFWVASGHWLDESRTINSYTIKPLDVLELQLRNQYIQLPPAGSNLDYFDHYAEGVLYKLSKKNRPVSLLTGQGSRESQGIWKERWVVLQGTKLHVYHKRKDTNKKVIDLPPDLIVSARILPSMSRSFFKASGNMSSKMLVLDISRDPVVPKLCFRGASQNDINHWERIFKSLNSLPPLSSPYLGGFGSPNLSSDENSTSISNTLSGYPSERKRNHTTTNAYNLTSTTVPAINPVLISNAKAAISTITGGNHSNSGSPPTSLDSHYKNQNGGYGSHRETSPPHQSAIPSSIKDDVRRRAITEPNRFRFLNPVQAAQQHGGSKGLSKPSGLKLSSQDGLQRSLDVSNVHETPFRLDSPPGSKRRPVLGTEYLDIASQALLASSSTRSSTAPLYSGYIWIYLPYPDTSSPNSLRRREIQKELDIRTLEVSEVGHRASIDYVDSNNIHSEALTQLLASPISPSNSNQSISSKGTSTDKRFCESGRYVKCFALISDLGHFQWVQVKKLGSQDSSEQELQNRLKESTSPPSLRATYGVQLKSSNRSLINNGNELEGIPSEQIESSINDEGSCNGYVNVSMMESVNMYFFCVKVPPNVIKDVLLDSDAVETTSPSFQHISSLLVSPYSTSGSIAPLGSGSETNLHAPQSQSSSGTSFTTSGVTKAANKIRHRLSSSLSTLSTSSTAASKPPLPGHNTKHQSMSGSISKGKNMTWPSISSSALDAGSSQDLSQQEKSAHPERATTVPLVGTSTPTRSLTNKSSYTSLKLGLPNITTDPSQYRNHDNGKSESDVLSAGMTPTHMFASPMSAGPFSPPTITPSSPTPSGSSLGSNSSSTSNIVSLAQNLQDVIGMAKLSTSPEQLTSTRTSPSADVNSTKNSKPRIVLSKVASANSPESTVVTDKSKQSRDQRVLLAEERVRAHEQQLELARKRRPNQQSQSWQSPQESEHGQQTQQIPPKIQTMQAKALDSATLSALCPFLELNDDSKSTDESEPYVILRGYTESEDEWKALQYALEKFLDEPINKHTSALPPQDTLIPSYHSPVEVKLSEKAERYLNAKETMIEEANLAASKAAIEAVRSPTPDILSGGVIPTVNGPVAQIRATSVSMTRRMNLSGGKDRERIDKDITANKVKAINKLAVLGDTSPNMTAITTSSTGASNTSDAASAQLLKDGYGASIKRGVSPAHSLSVGSGSSLLRARPRLSQQRSADELSKTSHLPIQTSNPYERDGGLIDSDSQGLNDNVGHYSTAVATSRNSTGSKDYSVKSVLKGTLSLNCDEEDFQDHRSATQLMSPNLGYTIPEKSARIGNRSQSLSAVTGVISLEEDIWVPSTNSQEGAVTATATVADNTINGGADTENLVQLKKKEELQPGARKRDSKSSIRSLYTHAEQLAIREAESRIPGTSQSTENTMKNDDEVDIFESSFLNSSIQASESVVQSPVMSTHARFNVGLHPLEGFDEGPNGSTEAPIRPPLGDKSNSSGSSIGKKHQTVLEASKAAVTGVIGKIRKSVG